MASRPIICTATGGECGHGYCIENGTKCICESGYSYDLLLIEYNTCYMPDWVKIAFPLSLLVLGIFAFGFCLYQYSISVGKPSRNIFGLVVFAVISICVYSVVLVATSLKPNAVSWVFYLITMVIHMCLLIPMVLRFIIPPAFQMIFMYPKWFDFATITYIAVTCVSLVYTWVFSTIALAYDNINMFNEGVTIWFGSCAIMALLLMGMIFITTKQLIDAINAIVLKPFYRDFSVLKKRARRVQLIALGLGIPAFVFLVICFVAHHVLRVQFSFRFVLTWILFIMLLILDLSVIWFGRSASSRNMVSTPKSTFVGDDEAMEFPLPGGRGRTVSFSQTAFLGRRESKLDTANDPGSIPVKSDSSDPVVEAAIV